ncbi:hypothetical protein KEM56_001130 [Ascosphaera pollenicola]|nr:hypothetical protein KEM56_001130 [Ascosphaera pollenicola]
MQTSGISIASTPVRADGIAPSDQLKRKWEQNGAASGADAAQEPKRTRTLGPFVMDDDDDDDELSQPFNFDTQDAALVQPTSYDTETVSSTFSLPTRSAIVRPVVAHEAPINSVPLESTPDISIIAVPQEKYSLRLCSGKTLQPKTRKPTPAVSYEQTIASRSTVAPGRAKKSYYGIDIHGLLDTIATEERSATLQQPVPQILRPSIEQPENGKSSSPLWTEKYRARRFVDLLGDDRTHRLVLRWLKGWDDIVFPGVAKLKPKKYNDNVVEERAHRKILLLAGPPGLGKTTLAHVCARQAGYEVMEINASDERSSNVVKGRIRDAIGTENVKSIAVNSDGSRSQKANRPVCLVIDEVDGVVGGSGGGEGGFIKSLIDLVMLDKKNSGMVPKEGTTKRKKKSDRFRLLRPMILICNDVYHPSLRPLRTSSIAEIIHVRQAPLEKVVNRMKSIFQQEQVPFETDGVRRLCEASWGISNIRNRTAHSRGIGEGDIRGILVAGEWIAKKLRVEGLRNSSKLTKKWVDKHFSNDSARDSQGLGRGGTREVVERAGFTTAALPMASFNDPYSTKPPGMATGGVADLRKRHAIDKLGHMIDAAGEYDRCVTDCFLKYPTQHYQDDTFLSKPNMMYDWLGFHDSLSSRIYANQSWELHKYLNQSILAFHDLFASSNRQNLEPKDDELEDEHPFAGPRADFSAYEAQKQHRATLVGFQASMSPAVLRLFRSQEVTATELIPNLIRMLSPDIKPTLVGASGRPGFASVRKESEKQLVQSAVRVMNGMNVRFERTKVEQEGAHGGWVYRMDPPLDTLIEFSKIAIETDNSATAPVRFAVRQALAQEHQKEALKRSTEVGQAKLAGTKPSEDGPKSQSDMLARLNGPKKDFFGRVISEQDITKSQEEERKQKAADEAKNGGKTGLTHAWIKYHDGFSNAVRKRITMQELLAGL